MKFPRPPLPALALACWLCALSHASQAAVVGYWRFEDSGNLGLDSGPNSLNLTNNNSVASVATVFPSPIPASGDSNALAGSFAVASSRYLSVADNAAFNFQDFTIESFIRSDTAGASSTVRAIAGQLSTTSNSAWQLGIAGTGSGLGARRLFLQLSTDGSNLVNIASTFTVADDTNFYAAASVDFNGVNSVAVTFYFQDLSTSNLQSGTVNGAIGTMFNSTAAFGIGATFVGASSSRHFDGLIDEVRLSNTALGESELLVVPEPGSGALALGALALWISFGRGFRLQNRKACGI